MTQQTLTVAQNNSATQKYEADIKAWQAAHPDLAPGARVNTVAYRTLQELAPLMRQPNPPQDVIDRYNNAAVEHLQFKTFIDPATGALMRGPTVPLPSGMPLPDGISLKPEPVSGSPRGPDIAGNIATELGKGDVKGLVEARDAAMKTDVSILGTTSTIRAVLPQVATGTLAEPESYPGFADPHIARRRSARRRSNGPGHECRARRNPAKEAVRVEHRGHAGDGRARAWQRHADVSEGTIPA